MDHSDHVRDWEDSAVSAEMRRYNIAVLGLCETRWTQYGQVRLITGKTLLFSGSVIKDHPSKIPQQNKECADRTMMQIVTSKLIFMKNYRRSSSKEPGGTFLSSLNAKIGSDNVGREHVMRRVGLGEINENGELFSDFTL